MFFLLQVCFWIKAALEHVFLSPLRPHALNLLGAENPVPIGSKGQCSFNPKTDLQEKEHFFQCGEKLVRVELTMRLRRGGEKVAQCCFSPFTSSSFKHWKEKIGSPHLQESKFLFQNIHIIRPSHPHIGTARNLQRLLSTFSNF